MKPCSARPNRRAVVASGVAFAVYVRAARPALAARAGQAPRFVLVILRGAVDGLAAVPPYGDPAYREARPRLAIAEPGRTGGALDLGGRFGLHPALARLHGRYRDGELLVLHAVASAYHGRSHFDGQDVLESGGTIPHVLADGWLNRAVGVRYAGTAEPAALALGQTVPLALRGRAAVNSWAPDSMPQADADLLAQLGELYRGDAVLGSALREAMARADYAPQNALVRPDGGALRLNAGKAFLGMAEACGRMLAAAAGPRVATLELGGWDTHIGQGATEGRLANQLSVLDGGLDALRTALGEAWSETVVAIVTEFGRTVAENGTAGTDHGTGAAAFLLGGAVQGGRVVADWPGLAAGRLFEGRDLAPTTDLRSVLKSVLRHHLGLSPAALDSVVFPGSGAIGTPSGLIRA